MAYSEVEFWDGESLEMMLFKGWYVGFVEVANITDYEQRKGICAVHGGDLHGLWSAVRRRHQNVELKKNPPQPNPEAFVHSVETRWARVSVHTHTKCRSGSDTYPVPSVGNDVFEIITLPRQEKRGLQVGLTMLLEATVEQRLGSSPEDGSERFDLLPRWV